MELTLTTERLLLKPFELADVDILIETTIDPVVMRYIREPSTREQVIESLPTWTRRGAGGRLGVWCVQNRHTGEALGTSILLPLPIEEDNRDWDNLPNEIMPDDVIEVGYKFPPRVWGQGFATEACSRLIQFAFENSPLNQVCAVLDMENKASLRVLEKCGLTHVGMRRAYGEQLPDIRITRDEWQARHQGAA